MKYSTTRTATNIAHLSCPLPAVHRRCGPSSLQSIVLAVCRTTDVIGLYTEMLSDSIRSHRNLHLGDWRTVSSVQAKQILPFRHRCQLFSIEVTSPNHLSMCGCNGLNHFLQMQFVSFLSPYAPVIWNSLL